MGMFVDYFRAVFFLSWESQGSHYTEIRLKNTPDFEQGWRAWPWTLLVLEECVYE